MRVTERKLGELRELRDWFELYLGRGWEGWLVNWGLVGRSQIFNTLNGYQGFAAVLLPRLRFAKDMLERLGTTERLAKPSPIQAVHQNPRAIGIHVLEPIDAQ